MAEPTKRDRELFHDAQRRYYERWTKDIGTCFDWGELEMTQAIAAAREGGRQEERERCAHEIKVMLNHRLFVARNPSAAFQQILAVIERGDAP